MELTYILVILVIGLVAGFGIGWVSNASRATARETAAFTLGMQTATKIFQAALGIQMEDTDEQ